MGTLVCSIKLNKVGGITVKVENADGKITSTIEMNGSQIVTKCAGDQDTSTITQIPGEIKIEVKAFKLLAETIECSSTKTTSHKSDDTFDIKSTKALTMKTDDEAVLEATKDLSEKGKNVNIEAAMQHVAIKAAAAGNVTIEGLGISLKATNELSGEGVQTKFKGTAQGEFTGAMLKIVADGIFEIGGAMVKQAGDGMWKSAGGVTMLG